jgi:choice-of-anchor C domain-containing protein
MAVTPSGDGYWMLGRSGRVEAVGDARSYGSPGRIPGMGAAVSLSPTPTGKGYWIASSKGSVWSFGDAPSLPRPPLSGGRVAAVASTPTGRGYWLVSVDGSVTGAGDARVVGGWRSSVPVVDFAPTSTGNGYWLTARDGTVQAFGDAQQFPKSPVRSWRRNPVVAMAVTRTGNGYWLLQSDGRIGRHGDAGRLPPLHRRHSDRYVALSIREPSAQDSGPVRLPSTTKLLPDAIVARSGGLQPDGVIALPVSGLPAIAVGDLVVAQPTAVAPRGFLRKVTGISTSGENLVLQTEEGSIPEAFPGEVFSVAGQFDNSDIAGLAPGVRLAAPPTPQAAGRATSAEVSPLALQDSRFINLEMDVWFCRYHEETLVLPEPCADRVSTLLHLFGSMKIQLEYEVDASFLTLKGPSVTLTQKAVIDADLNVDSWRTDLKLSVSYDLLRDRLRKSFKVGKISGILAGRVRLALSGSGLVTVSTSLSSHEEVEAKTTLDVTGVRADGFASNSKISVGRFALAPSPDKEVALSVGPEISLMFYNAAGPFVGLEGGIRVTLQDDRIPRTRWFLFMDASFGLKARVPFLNIVGLSISVSEDLWHAPGFPINIPLCDFSLCSNDGGAITIDTPEDQLARVGEPYHLQLHQVGAALPLKWRVVWAELPDGISFDANTGVFSGTPTKSNITFGLIELTDADGLGALYSFNFTARDLPSAPRDVMAAGFDKGVRLTWRLPDDTGYAGALRYRLTGPTGESVELPVEANTYEFKDLTNGTEYTFRIAAINDLGVSPEVQVTSKAGAATVPPGDHDVALAPTLPGGTFGDPHFNSFDGGYYDFQAAGEYVLAKSTIDDFEVHSRFTRHRGLGAVSFNHGVAARVGSSVIAFGDDAETSLGAGRKATLDGQPLPLEPGQLGLPGGSVLVVDADRRPIVRWPDGTELAPPSEVGGHTSLTLAESRWGKVQGLLGNANHDRNDDVASRDGVVVTDIYDEQQLYDSFGPSWRVDPDASFFRTPLPADLAQPVNPQEIVTISELSAEARANAERLCRDRGLAPGAGLEQCILDVGLTGDVGLADHAAEAATRLRSSVDLGPLGAPVEDTRPLQLGSRGSGSLGTPLSADIHTVTLQAGSTVRVSTTGVCPGQGTFSITLVAPSGRPVGRTHGDGCGSMQVTQLRETGPYELRVFDSGGFTGPYELQVDEQAGAPNLLSNGGFEAPEAPAPFLTLEAGADMEGWSVTSGSVDLTTESYWEPHDGAQSVDLNGCSPGRIAQQFATEPGRTYTTRFAYAGNPDPGGAAGLKRFHAEVNGASVASFSFDSSTTTRTDMGWRTGEFTFAAAGATTELAFVSDMPGCHGAVLDDVTVS